MIKVEPAVKKETYYIAYFNIILSMLMQVVFILLKKWDYTVILGNLLSWAVSTANFFLMGLTVQKAVTLEKDDAKKLIKKSQKLRNLGIFVFAAVGVALSVFNTVAVIVPLFFTRIAVAFRPLIKDKKEVINK